MRSCCFQNESQRGTREPGFAFIVVSLVYVVVQDGRATLLHRAENDLFKKGVCTCLKEQPILIPKVSNPAIVTKLLAVLDICTRFSLAMVL